ncbi:kinase-like domain-containing protein [Lentinula raphanica]|nr:kinase-like domain-containing protein [Lentinula raphanica]
MDDLNDQEILKRLNKGKLTSGHSVLKLSQSTIAKLSQDVDKYDELSDASEANALQLVFTKTTIPVPRLRRVVNCRWIIEDYIQGTTLADAWPNYSIWRKIRVAFILRRYVRQLRRLKASPSTPPGPISVEGPRICESPVFGTIRDRRGPFASYADLADFFSERAEIAFRYAKLPEHHPKRSLHFDDSEALVFTHQDINPRNIIVGEDGRLWMIDWGLSGFYPPWFEYVAMMRQSDLEKHLGSYCRYWDILIPFICGPYFEQDSWLHDIAWGFYVR